MKKTVIWILAALLLLLCGCTESEIACGIDAENRAFLRYDMNLDLKLMTQGEKIPLLAWLRTLGDTLKAEGFTVEHNALAATDKPYYFRAELVRQGADRAEAVSLLREMLTDETLTPFTAVACEYLPQPLQDALLVSVRLEPDRILATTELASYPDQLRERVEPALAAGSIRLTLTLPATELPEGETAELRDGLATKSLTVPLTGNGTLRLATVQYTGGDAAEVWWGGRDRTAPNAAALEGAVQDDVQRLKRFETVCIAAAAALAVLAALCLLAGMRARRGRKTE